MYKSIKPKKQDKMNLRNNTDCLLVPEKVN